MFNLLSADRYPLVRHLFVGLDYHLIIEAVLIGNSPAKVYVDNPENPKTAFMLSPEGNFIVGDNQNAAFNQGFQNWIEENFIQGEEDEMVIESFDEAWRPVLEALLEKRPPYSYDRYYYELSQSNFETPPALATKFTLEAVTETFIQRDDIENMAVIHESITGNWISREIFFEKAFGFCILHENKVISWSVVDCVAGNRCEIGIHTHEAYRRQGLATTLVASVVDYALKHGFERIGWHCWFDNWGSIGVADNVGFVQKHPYRTIISLQPYFVHHAFRGYKRLQLQDYAQAEREYLIALKHDNEPEAEVHLLRTYFEMARVQAGLGNEQAAFEFLEKSLRHGLNQYPEAVQKAQEFEAMRSSTQWQSLFRA